MKNWKTNLGGAISVTGTSFLAVGILPQLAQLSPVVAGQLTPKELGALWFITLAGFVLSGIGKGFTALFAADSSVVKEVEQKVSTVATAVDKINVSGPDPTNETLSDTVKSNLK